MLGFFVDIWKIMNTDIFLIDNFFLGGGIERMLVMVYETVSWVDIFWLS